jgi:hypothetical protein
MIELTIHVVPPEGDASNGRVFVSHVFRGETEEEAREVFKQHAAGCEFLTPAIAEDRIEEEIDELPDEAWPAFEPIGDEEDGDDEDDEDEEEEE